MSVHIEAKEGQIAETVLLPGDPLRAKFIADNLLEDAVCYNQVRNMLGFTGTYKGKRVSVQGTGMGVPSISIYVQELMESYNCQNLIRIGTCGAIREDVALRDVILAMAASTDNNQNLLKFGGMSYAPHANFELLRKAWEVTQKKGLKVQVGNILTSDTFYHEDMEAAYREWKKHGILAVEMESSALYTLAARFGRKALTILTVSDHIVLEQRTSAEERQTAFGQMIEIALEAVS